LLEYLLRLPLAQLILEEGLVTYECLPGTIFGTIWDEVNLIEKLYSLHNENFADHIDYLDEVSRCYSGIVL